MKTTHAIALGFLLVVSLAAFKATERQPSTGAALAARSSFGGVIDGRLRTEMHGAAKYGVVAGRGGAPTVLTISLGETDTNASILFTRTNGGRLGPGTYAVTGRDDGTDEIRALVMTGSAERPTGVFRGHSGTLVITSAGDNILRGSFRIEATGFLGTDPSADDLRIRASGGFTAVRQ
jgi:hypothetical protein